MPSSAGSSNFLDGRNWKIPVVLHLRVSRVDSFKASGNSTCGRKRVCRVPCFANPLHFYARMLLDFTMENDSPFPVPVSLVNVVTMPSGVVVSDAIGL